MNYSGNIEYIAGGYCRLSIMDDNKIDESSSIKNQKKFIQEYALNKNIKLHDFYVDDGYTGANFERPDFKRLINDLKNGIINCVIVKDLSRLGRDFIMTGDYVYKFFPENNIRFVAILDNYDSFKESEADDMLPIKAVFNDLYIKDTSRKIISVRHEMMANGEFVGSSVPYGFKRSEENNKKLVIDDYASDIVKRIFDMKINGKTFNMIALSLNDEGILPPDVYRGKKLSKITITTNLWKASTIKNMIQNEAYIGTLIQGKYQRVSLKSKKKRLLPKNKWIIVKNSLPRIVSDEIFNKANSQVNKSSNGTREREYDYLLKGLVVCADCGATMLIRRSKNKKDPTIITPIYVCRTYAKYRNNICSMHYFREEDLNNIVLKEVRNVLSNYNDNKKLEKAYEKVVQEFDAIKDYERKLKNHQEKIVSIDKAIADLYKDKDENIISFDEYMQLRKDLENDRKYVEDMITKIKDLILNTKIMVTDSKEKMKYINDFLKTKNPNKASIQTIINKIEIDKDKRVKIKFNFNYNKIANA